MKAPPDGWPRQPERPERWDNDLVAYCTVIGKQGETWEPLPVDKPEWTDPAFAHQN